MMVMSSFIFWHCHCHSPVPVVSVLGVLGIPPWRHFGTHSLSQPQENVESSFLRWGGKDFSASTPRMMMVTVPEKASVMKCFRCWENCARVRYKLTQSRRTFECFSFMYCLEAPPFSSFQSQCLKVGLHRGKKMTWRPGVGNYSSRRDPKLTFYIEPWPLQPLQKRRKCEWEWSVRHEKLFSTFHWRWLIISFW